MDSQPTEMPSALRAPGAAHPNQADYSACRAHRARFDRTTVLAVGADAASARLLETAFGRLRLNLISMTTAFGIFDLLATFKPRLVLIDVDAPGLDWSSLVLQLRSDAELAGLVVVLWSSASEAELAAQVKDCSADGGIAKAPDASVIERRIRRWLSR